MPGYKVSKDIFDDCVDMNRFTCRQCSRLLKDPVQLVCCRCRLCQSCVDCITGDPEVQYEPSTPKCPECGKQLKQQNDGSYYIADTHTRQEINSLAVICRVCNWKGAFGVYELHIKSCDPSSRVRPFISRASPEPSFGAPAVSIHCRFCNLSVPCQEIDSHQRLCPLRGKRCPFREIGCQEAASFVHPADLEEHMRENAYHHLELIVENSFKNVRRFYAVSFTRSNEERPRNSAATLTDATSNPCPRAQLAGRLQFDFRLSLIENRNHDGSMIWKIPQFSQRKADAENGKYTSIFSLPFYTGRYGFKMCLRLYIMGDGIGKGTHLSLFFVVMRGEFDNILQWPFTHKVTFKLINQAGGRDIVDTFQPDPMSSSFRKPKSDMNIASGCPRFVSHTKLERGGFVVDDTIFIKCMIDTSTICHP